MRHHMTEKNLHSLIQCEDISTLDSQDLIDLFREEEKLVEHAPDGFCQIDPRNGERVLYSTIRASRPHDNRPDSQKGDNPEEKCVICRGNTTGILDYASLSEGFTFLNKNLYPILFPEEGRFPVPESALDPEMHLRSQGIPAHGFHFLQWTSTYHDVDWHNLPPKDQEIVLSRLVRLEATLLREWPGTYVSIIKNGGHQVGGSIEHGHQQILLSSIAPRRIREDQRFEKEHQESFSGHIIRNNPPELLLRDYGDILLMVPFFMRRPYDMILAVKDPSKSRLHHLTDQELAQLARGWHEAIRLIHLVMPTIHKDTAYNVTVHNGSETGLYCEFLPYTQATGGYEHLGLSLCHATPPNAAQTLRELLPEI